LYRRVNGDYFVFPTSFWQVENMNFSIIQLNYRLVMAFAFRILPENIFIAKTNVESEFERASSFYYHAKLL
jgi:hypothetical protein